MGYLSPILEMLILSNFDSLSHVKMATLVADVSPHLLTSFISIYFETHFK
jgi:hypothetical protein